MFDLPSGDNPFRVDDKQLTRRFRKLQQIVHPDAWSAKGEVCVRCNQFGAFRSDQEPRTLDRWTHPLPQTCLHW
jgi:hypothetical protein